MFYKGKPLSHGNQLFIAPPSCISFNKIFKDIKIKEILILRKLFENKLSSLDHVKINAEKEFINDR